MNTRRLKRISAELEDEIRRYIETHQQKNSHNLQKNETFNKILNYIESNTLSLEKLIKILEGLTVSENKRLFYHGVITSASNLESGAATCITLLFSELGHTLNYYALKDIVSGKIGVRIKTQAFESIVSLWLMNPYDDVSRNHLDHELKWKIYDADKYNYKDRTSLAQAIYGKYPELNQDNEVRFISNLNVLQSLCPQYMPEFLAELRLHYSKLSAYQSYIEVMATVFKAKGHTQKGLIQSLLGSQYEVVTDIVKKFPGIFFELSSSMQEKVHQDLLLNSDQVENALNQIHKMALNEMEVKSQEKGQRKRRVSLLDSISIFEELTDDKILANFSNKQRVVDFLYSRIKEIAQEILDKKIIEAAKARIEEYLATKQEGVKAEPDKTKRRVFQTLLESIRGFGQPGRQVRLTKTWLQKFLAKTFEDQDRKEKLFFSGYFNGQETSGAAKCFADLYCIASGRKLTDAEMKKMVQGELPRNTVEKNKQLAAVIIEKYLETTKGNLIKTDFFRELGEEILNSDFTPNIIANFLSKKFPWLSGRKKLFATKYIATIDKSGAANCLAELYEEASGKAMTPEEIKAMVWTGKFPQDDLLKREIEEWIENPSRSIEKNDFLNQEISFAYQKLNDAKAVLQRIKQANNMHQRVADQQALINNGIASVMNLCNSENTHFDLQGHIVLEVPFANSNVLCSLDIKNKLPLIKNMMVWLTVDVINQDEGDILRKAISALLALPSRSSIIPLREEMEMHMRYLSRAMELLYPTLDWTLIRKNAAFLIDLVVKKEFQEILLTKSVYDSVTKKIDMTELNCKLDEARKRLMPIVEKKFIELVVDYQPSIHEINKLSFSQVSATGMEYLRTDEDNQLCVRISEGPLRSIHRLDYVDKRVSLFGKIGVELNVSSIVNRDLSSADAVVDVADKLREHHRVFNQAGHNGIMIINLTIPLHSIFNDVVATILKGAHLFNQEQIFAGQAESFVYVLNADVSQHGKNIKYDSFNGAISEAALMNEMALLACFFSHVAILPPLMRRKILNEYRNMHERYIDFLKSEQQLGGVYFARDSEERGEEVYRCLFDLKKYMEANTHAFNADSRASMYELAVKTLMKLVSIDKHLKCRYASLVQSLSVFIESASLTCSEGMNGLDEMVLKRVDLLHTVAHLHRAGVRIGDDKRLKIVSAMFTFLNSDSVKIENLKKIVTALNDVLNEYGVYGAAVNLGHEARGVSNDVQASETVTKVGKLGFFDRAAIAEPQQLTNLQQKYAMRDQDQSEALIEEFKKIKQSRL